MAKKVLLHIDPNGATTVEAQGYEGGTCLDATAPFEDLFGTTERLREMVGACAGDDKDGGERVFGG